MRSISMIFKAYIGLAEKQPASAFAILALFVVALVIFGAIKVAPIGVTTFSIFAVLSGVSLAVLVAIFFFLSEKAKK